jgi:hypothetical protein
MDVMARYAVNLVGLMCLSKMAEHLPLYLLLKGIVTEEVVMDKNRLGTEALVVSGDVSAERWQAIVKVVRLKFGAAQFPLYENRGKGWRRLRGVPPGGSGQAQEEGT